MMHAIQNYLIQQFPSEVCPASLGWECSSYCKSVGSFISVTAVQTSHWWQKVTNSDTQVLEACGRWLCRPFTWSKATVYAEHWKDPASISSRVPNWQAHVAISCEWWSGPGTVSAGKIRQQENTWYTEDNSRFVQVQCGKEWNSYTSGHGFFSWTTTLQACINENEENYRQECFQCETRCQVIVDSCE